MEYQLEFLSMFSSIGLVYIGYASKSKIQGIVLGAIGTVPLFLVMVFFNHFTMISEKIILIGILISFLAIGAFCGFAGLRFAKSRQKAMIKNKSKKKLNKGSRYKR